MSLTTQITKSDIAGGNRSRINIRVAHGYTPGVNELFVNVFLYYNARALTYVSNTASPAPDELDENSGVIAWYNVEIKEKENEVSVSNHEATLDCTSSSSTTNVTALAIEVGRSAQQQSDTVSKSCP